MDTAKAISNIILLWDANKPPPPEPDWLELELHDPDSSQRPLPPDSVQHISRAELLPSSASHCPFCEMIRSSLIFAHFHKFGAKEMGLKHRMLNYDKLPISDILRDITRNKFLYEPLYSSSPIYLKPIQGDGLYRGVAPEDGYYLQSIKVILRPTPWNKANWRHALEDVHLAAFSDSGRLNYRIPSFC